MTKASGHRVLPAATTGASAQACATRSYFDLLTQTVDAGFERAADTCLIANRGRGWQVNIDISMVLLSQYSVAFLPLFAGKGAR